MGNSVLTGGANHAFLAMSSASAMTDLGSIRTQDRSGAPVAGNSVAKAIDRAGDEIVGWSETNDPRDLATNPQSYHATTWTLSNGVWAATDLGTLYAPANSGQNGTGCGSGDQQLGNATAVSYASAVNNSGTVVGVADYRLERCPALGSSPDFIYPFFGHAFRWTGSGPMEDLGTLDNNTNASNDCAFSQANGENGAGDVVGFLGSEALDG